MVSYKEIENSYFLHHNVKSSFLFCLVRLKLLETEWDRSILENNDSLLVAYSFRISLVIALGIQGIWEYGIGEPLALLW